MAIPLLETSSPRPDLAEALELYGRLAGSWSIDASLLGSDGEWRDSRGEWHFGWGLGGLAVVDVIHSPVLADLADGAAFAEVGTTIRVPDPATGTWQITFVSAVRRSVTQLVGRAAGDDIFQDGVDEQGRPIRWNFTEIADERFLWQGYVSHDGGRTWTRNEVMRATRQHP